jgi:hypothetical protein
MDGLPTRKAWQVLVWGSPLPASFLELDREGYYFFNRDAAENCAARQIANGWDEKWVEVVEVDLPLFPPPLPPPLPPPQTTEQLSDLEEFLQWLEKRMQSVGYTVEKAPNYLKDAYISGKPSDLNPLVWHEWLKFKSPNASIANGEVDPPTFFGPRGGIYTMDVTADGRPYRRYF